MRKTIKDRVKEGQTLQQAINNLNNSYYKRELRLNKRVREILESKEAYFITFTISPKYEFISFNQLVRKIKEALGSASGYIFNADYGKTNGRLHFHALSGFDATLDYTILNNIYKYGAIDYKKILVNNETALKDYITKQQLHATKQTASTIWVSRKKKNKD